MGTVRGTADVRGTVMRTSDQYGHCNGEHLMYGSTVMGTSDQYGHCDGGHLVYIIWAM